MSLFRKSSLLTLSFLFFVGSVMADEKQEIFNKTVEVETVVKAVAMADLDIAEERASKSVTWKIKLFSPTDLEQRKKNLITQLCRETGADILIDPQFEFEKKILGGGKLTVTGYPAKYTNFRNMTDKEIEGLIVDPVFEDNRIIFITDQP